VVAEALGEYDCRELEAHGDLDDGHCFLWVLADIVVVVGMFAEAAGIVVAIVVVVDGFGFVASAVVGIPLEWLLGVSL
jgi:hypothetical protein